MPNVTDQVGGGPEKIHTAHIEVDERVLVGFRREDFWPSEDCIQEGGELPRLRKILHLIPFGRNGGRWHHRNRGKQ